MSGPRYSEKPWRSRTRYACNVCGFGTLERVDIVRHVKQQHPTSHEVSRGAVPPPDALDGIEFASQLARDEAIKTGLTATSLRRATSPTGRGGRYTVRDVRYAAPAEPSAQGEG